MSETLERMKAQAVDLSRLGFRRTDTLDALDYSYEIGKKMWADPELKAAYDIAKKYEDDQKEAIKAYAGGWPQCVNYLTCGQDSASNNTFTTIINIGQTQQPNIDANKTNTQTFFRIYSFGIIGSAAGTATTTYGINANGGARGAAAGGTALVISASATPATATVQTWHAEFNGVVLTPGATGTIQVQGQVIGISATPATDILVPATQAAAATWNTQQANYFNPVATWSVSAAGNLYQINGFAVLQLN